MTGSPFAEQRTELAAKRAELVAQMNKSAADEEPGLLNDGSSFAAQMAKLAAKMAELAAVEELVDADEELGPSPEPPPLERLRGINDTRGGKKSKKSKQSITFSMGEKNQ